MSTHEQDPPYSESDKLFDAIVEDSYSSDELDLIEYIDTFNADGESFNLKASQFMKSEWQPIAHVKSSMNNELSSVSESLKEVVLMMLRCSKDTHEAAREIAEIITVDLTRRITYFTGISSVQFNEVSGVPEMTALFEEIINVGLKNDQAHQQIVVIYRTELMSQLKAISRGYLA